MNPYENTNQTPFPPLDSSHDPPVSSLSPWVTETGLNPVTESSLTSAPSSERDGGQSGAENPDLSTPPVVFSLTSRLRSSLTLTTSPLNPYPAPTTPPSCQVSVIMPSPDLHPSPPQCSDDSCPDLECSICFSQFNNVFRCPKMLQCKHTFCLECLARINVKSAQPNAIQCPLCRSYTALPDLGLPRLTTDSDVLSYLPAAMQRVYSVRFQRSKGKLQVKRSSDGNRWGRRSLTSLRSRTLDVGLPSPPAGGSSISSGPCGCGGALFALTSRPACQAFLLTSVVMMMMLLTGIVVFLLIYNKDQNSE
ncbi:uncharacterized protein LOC141790023 [Halichoeres trimaculatus]|uniref:uncharacterized protein LOC141790023 n=1 Tax=Halichoeres trimaculatus TaxID=147232 RepID=UPI003D9E6502